jgi:cell division protein FtsN
MQELNMNYKSKQRGGTVLGIIIGLIIGLSIAVVVAVTITKTPIPFVDRGFKPGRDIDASQKNQLPDLNQSLYGNREAVKRAAQEFQPEQQADAQAPAQDAAARDAGKALAKATPAPGKAGEIKTVAATAPNAAPAPAEQDKWTYYLQAGAFRDSADAENTKAKLALLGVETQVSERTTDTGSLYRVRVGPFGEIEAMNKVRSKLSENGVDVAVVRIQKQ